MVSIETATHSPKKSFRNLVDRLQTEDCLIFSAYPWQLVVARDTRNWFICKKEGTSFGKFDSFLIILINSNYSKACFSSTYFTACKKK